LRSSGKRARPYIWRLIIFLLGLHDDELRDDELRDADPDTLRYRIWHLPARLARHARERVLKISPHWPWKDAFLTCWQRLRALPAPA
jgi:hypothetical protein